MRTPLLPLLVVVLCSCGRGELSTPSPTSEVEEVAPPVVTNRVRLESNFERSDGFRFEDRALLTRTVNGGRCPVSEVRTSDGTVVEGEAARTDLQTDTGRFLALFVPGGAGCVSPRLVSSVAEVDASGCGEWRPSTLLQLSFQGEPDFVGTGLVVHTARGEVYRVRIVQSGFDSVGGVDFVTFDYEAVATSCAIGGAACVVRDDCCNSRHSCISGICQY